MTAVSRPTPLAIPTIALPAPPKPWVFRGALPSTREADLHEMINPVPHALERALEALTPLRDQVAAALDPDIVKTTAGIAALEAYIPRLRKVIDMMADLTDRQIGDASRVLKLRWHLPYSNIDFVAGNLYHEFVACLLSLGTLHRFAARDMVVGPATEYDLTDDKRIKPAANMLNKAAGIFEFVATKLPLATWSQFGAGGVIELSSPQLYEALAELSLLESQELAICHAIVAKSSPGVVIKLCIDAVQRASRCRNALGGAIESAQKKKSQAAMDMRLGVLDNYLAITCHLYRCMVDRVVSKQALNAGKYGDAVGFMRRAVRPCGDEQGQFSNVVNRQMLPEYLDAANTFLNRAREELAKLEKENECIYMCAIPDDAQLVADTQTTGYCIAKAIPYDPTTANV
jgi:BRO1-like domain